MFHLIFLILSAIISPIIDDAGNHLHRHNREPMIRMIRNIHNQETR
jgi:hypothetical protein